MTAALLLLGATVPLAAVAATSAPGATASSWPGTWNLYRFQDRAPVLDVNGDQNPSILDLTSGSCTGTPCTGTSPTVYYAANGSAAFFRIRLATDISDDTKGGLVGGAFLTQIAVGGVVKAVIGVDGKSSSADYVYVSDSVGGIVTPVYTYPFDSAGGQESAGMRVVPVGDGTGHVFLDYQVPLGFVEDVSGGAIDASTPIQMYYGSSAAANLATINKDFMAGNVASADFSQLATVSFSSAELSISSEQGLTSGPNPPQANTTSTFDVVVTASNTGGGELTGVSVEIPFGSTVTIGTATSTAGTVSGSSTTRTWSAGTLLPGESETVTFSVSVTPTAGAVGDSISLVSAQSASSTDAANSTTSVATAPLIATGPVADDTNDAPAADDVTREVLVDGTLLVDLGAHTSELDGDPVTFSIISGPINGTLATVDPGTYSYVPDAGYSGSDSFTYRACDDESACDTGTVTIAVTATAVPDPGPVVPDPVVPDPAVPSPGTPVPAEISAEVDEDGSILIDLAQHVSNPAGEPLTFGILAAPVHGALAAVQPAVFEYTPHRNYSGPDSFTYEYCDTSGSCGAGTARINVTALDEAPALAATGVDAKPAAAVSLLLLVSGLALCLVQRRKTAPNAG